MGKNIKVNIKGLEDLQKQIEDFQSSYDAFIEGLGKEIARRLIRKVKQRTPVGEYPEETEKDGGTLRRGWSGSVKKGRIKIRKMIGMYEVEVTNPTEYADYVEIGHRTRGGKSWVPGQFFLQISEEEIQAIAPALVEKRIEQKLKEMMG